MRWKRFSEKEKNIYFIKSLINKTDQKLESVSGIAQGGFDENIGECSKIADISSKN